MFLFKAFEEYWNLYHKVIFDGKNKLILINKGVTEIDVQRDIYSAWKEWSLLEVNTKFHKAIDTVGGEPTVAGQFLDVTYFLINDWKLKPYPGSYSLNILGNIFDIDGGAISTPADNLSNIQNNININTNTSVIVRKVSDNGGEINLDEVNSKLDNQFSKLVQIENRIVSVQSINASILSKLSEPLDVVINDSQMDVVRDILLKVTEMWMIHGLSSDDLLVNKTQRVVSDIEQTFTNVGDDVVVKRTS